MSFREQESAGATNQAHFTDSHTSLARLRIGSLPNLDGLTLPEFVRQISMSPVSPGYTFDQSQISILDVEKAYTNQQQERLKVVEDYVERVPSIEQPLDNQEEGCVSEADNGSEDQLALPPTPPRPPSPGCVESLPSILTSKEQDNQEKGFVSKAGNSSEDQLASPFSSPKSPPWHSHLEEQVIEKDRHLQLAGFGICLGALLATSRICVTILRKLSYTQQFVERMTNRGWPRWVFFF